MAYTNHEINALISIAPGDAKTRILDALRDAKMHRADAAKILDCHGDTLRRWIVRLGLETEIGKLMRVAKKEGWFHDRKGGRPTKKKRVKAIRRK